MNKEWSLDVLYKGYDDPQFAADEAELDHLIKEFGEFAADLKGDPKEELVKAITLNQELYAKVSELFSFASLSQATNTSDIQAASIQGRLSGKMSALAAPRTALVQYIASLDNLPEIIDSDPLLKEHEFYLTNIKEDARYTLSPEVEKVISLYEISGSSAWSDLQSFLTSTVPVEYDGKITNLSDIRNLAYDPDPAVRKAAYEAELKSYDRIREEIHNVDSAALLSVIDSYLANNE